MPDDIRTITEAPTVGKHYLVPSIFMERFGGLKPMWWPVHGRIHNDVGYFNFEPLHYHIDVRFLNKRHLHQIGNFNDGMEHTPLQRSFSQPVSQMKTYKDGKWEYKDLAPVELRKAKCIREQIDYPYSDMPPVKRLNTDFAGKKCAKTSHGFVCPHQHYPIGQVPADKHGIVTCPLHGIRINATTGVCVGPSETADV